MSRVAGKPYSVYLLWSPSAGRYHIGLSENAPLRLAQHNQGLSRGTARFRPWVLVHQEAFSDYQSARQPASARTT